jgi:protein SCO1/2
MTISIKTRAGLLLAQAMLLAAFSAQAAGSASAALPPDSVYHLTVPLVDQDNYSFALAARHGQPQVISMFYTSCQFVCPMLIDTIRATADKLPEQERARLSTLLVSFDPERDTVAVLKSVADQRGLDAARWTLARSDAASVRKLAAALGIQYRLLSNGEYNHSTVLILLDGQGRIVGRSNKLGMADPAFVALIRKTLRLPS